MFLEVRKSKYLGEVSHIRVGAKSDVVCGLLVGAGEYRVLSAEY